MMLYLIFGSVKLTFPENEDSMIGNLNSKTYCDIDMTIQLDRRILTTSGAWSRAFQNLNCKLLMRRNICHVVFVGRRLCHPRSELSEQK